MIYEYTIKASADPENPNEQSVGCEIIDDRLFEQTVVTVSSNDCTYTKGKFTKNFLSNKLSSTIITFSLNDVIVIQTK